MTSYGATCAQGLALHEKTNARGGGLLAGRCVHRRGLKNNKECGRLMSCAHTTVGVVNVQRSGYIRTEALGRRGETFAGEVAPLWRSGLRRKRWAVGNLQAFVVNPLPSRLPGRPRAH